MFSFFKKIIAKIVNLFRRIADEGKVHVKEDIEALKEHFRQDLQKVKESAAEDVKDIKKDVNNLRDLIK